MSAKYQAAGIQTGTLIPTKILTEALKAKVFNSFSRSKKRKSRFLKDDSYLMIMSQDCDLNKPNSNFPTMEVLVGRPVSSVNERLTRSKSARKLIVKHHSIGLLEFENEFTALLEKSEFEDFLIANSNNLVVSKGAFTRYVIEWKILGYCREPFPDKINQVIKNYLDSTSGHKLLDLLQDGDSVHKLMGFVVPEEEGANHYYAYLILLLYDVSDDTKEEIRQKYSVVLSELATFDCDVTIGNARDDINHPASVIAADIPLDTVISPFDVQLGDFLKLKEVNLEYLSYSDEEGNRIDSQD